MRVQGEGKSDGPHSIQHPSVFHDLYPFVHIQLVFNGICVCVGIRQSELTSSG